MSKNLRRFGTTGQYEAYIASPSAALPNVSLITETNTVEYNPDVAVSIADAVIICDSATYNGETQVATNIVVTLSGNTLVSGTDYTVSNNDGGINAGNYTFMIDGIGNYTGSKNGTFTINKAQGEVTTAPTAITGLTPTGSAQALVNAGSSTGIMMYNLDGGAWSSSIPTASNIGTYTVGYKAAESANYTESATGSVEAKIVCPYVEIAGIKWATMNVGANSVTDIGLYYAWGDTQGYTADQVGSGEGQKYFGWADYKYGNGTSSPGATGMTKYNSTDGKTVLEASDDAVTAAWGDQWRMPTTDEFFELGEVVTTAWTDDYQGSGVAGMICTDKTDSSKVLFFPYCGLCFDGNVYNVGINGCCWSSSLYSSNIQNACNLLFDYGGPNWQYTDVNRYYGFTVRGVVNEPN